MKKLNLRFDSETVEIIHETYKLLHELKTLDVKTQYLQHETQGSRHDIQDLWHDTSCCWRERWFAGRPRFPQEKVSEWVCWTPWPCSGFRNLLLWDCLDEFLLRLISWLGGRHEKSLCNFWWPRIKNSEKCLNTCFGDMAPPKKN